MATTSSVSAKPKYHRGRAFTLFGALPYELQGRIWGFCLEAPKIIVELFGERVTFAAKYKIPAILHVNQQSRYEGLKVYKQLVTKRYFSVGNTRMFYVDLTNDIVYLKPTLPGIPFNMKSNLTWKPSFIQRHKLLRYIALDLLYTPPQQAGEGFEDYIRRTISAYVNLLVNREAFRVMRGKSEVREITLVVKEGGDYVKTGNMTIIPIQGTPNERLWQYSKAEMTILQDILRKELKFQHLNERLPIPRKHPLPIFKIGFQYYYGY